MILDHIDHAEKYACLGQGFEEGIRFLKAHQDGKLADGKHEISDHVYAMVNRYVTKPVTEGVFEAHRKYIDVQCMLEGNEILRWAPIEQLRHVQSVPEKDFYEYEGEGIDLPLLRDMMMILFPSDVHMPGLIWEQKQPIRKLVLKVLVESSSIP